MAAHNRQIEVHDALLSLRPNSAFSVKENDINRIEWYDNTDPPSRLEIEAEILRLQEITDGLYYQLQRKEEYPSFADQFDLLYHGGYDAWKDAIQQIKDKYPK
jgi:hypothetical protein